MKVLSTIGIAAVAAVCVAYAAERASATAAPATATAVEGSVKGTVKFDGKRPETKPLSISVDTAKGCCPPGKEVDAKDPSLVIGEGDGIANVVVTVEVPDAKVTPAADALHIDQKECHFEPHVQVVPVGGKIVFLNSDQVSHNVHTYAQKNDSFNKTIAPGSKEEQTLAKGDKIEVKCDIHAWMNSWIYVTDTPYYAITSADGSFEIKGLKPGTYRATFWHEKLPKTTAEIVVKDDGSSEAVAVKMGEKKAKK